MSLIPPETANIFNEKANTKHYNYVTYSKHSTLKNFWSQYRYMQERQLLLLHRENLEGRDTM